MWCALWIRAALAAGVVGLSGCAVLAPLRNRWLGPRALPPEAQSLLAVDCWVDCDDYRYPLAAPTLGGDGIIRIPVRWEREITRRWPEAEFRSSYGPGAVIRRVPQFGLIVWRTTPSMRWILIDCQRQRVAPWATSVNPAPSVQHRDPQGRVVFTAQTWQPAFMDGQPAPHRITGGAHQLYAYFCR